MPGGFRIVPYNKVDASQEHVQIGRILREAPLGDGLGFGAPSHFGEPYRELSSGPEPQRICGLSAAVHRKLAIELSRCCQRRPQADEVLRIIGIELRGTPEMRDCFGRPLREKESKSQVCVRKIGGQLKSSPGIGPGFRQHCDHRLAAFRGELVIG